MSQWAGFADASYGAVVGAGPARTLVSAGDLGAPDLAAIEVTHYLRQDAVLQRIFGGRIERTMWPSEGDPRQFPRCGVSLASSDNSERPTATSVEECSVFVSTFWDAKVAEVLPDGRASVATALAHVKRVLRATPARVLVVWYQDEQKQIAHELRGIGGEFFGNLNDMQGRRYGVFHQLEFRYRLHVDRTGVLVNLA